MRAGMFRRCQDEDTDDSPAVDSLKKKMSADHDDQERWRRLGARLHVVYEIDNREQMLIRFFQGLREVLRGCENIPLPRAKAGAALLLC